MISSPLIFLYTCLRYAVLAYFRYGKSVFEIHLFKVFVICTSIMLAAIFTSFEGILLKPVAFFEFNEFIILYIFAGLAFGKWNVSLYLSISFISKFLGWLINYIFDIYSIILWYGWSPSEVGATPMVFPSVFSKKRFKKFYKFFIFY